MPLKLTQRLSIVVTVFSHTFFTGQTAVTSKNIIAASQPVFQQHTQDLQKSKQNILGARPSTIPNSPALQTLVAKSYSTSISEQFDTSHSTGIFEEFDASHYAPGSAIELARQAAIQIPVSSSVMNDELRALPLASDDEIFFTIPDGRYVNKLYSGIQLREFEATKVDEFKLWAAEKELSIPLGFLDEHNIALKYLNTVNFDFQQAYDGITDTNQWYLNELAPLMQRYEELGPLLNSGALYAYGRDKENRSIVHLNCRAIVDQELSIEQILQLSDFVNGYLLFNAMLPGRIEQSVLIIDTKDVALYEIPLKKIGQLVIRNTKYWRHGFAYIAIINVSWVLKPATKLIRQFLDPFQKEKTQIFTNDFQNFFDQRIGKSKLEKKFGGELPNKKSDFFPPELNF